MLDSIQDFRWKGCRWCFYRNRDESLQEKKEKERKWCWWCYWWLRLNRCSFQTIPYLYLHQRHEGSLLVYQDFCLWDIPSLNDISLLPPSLSLSSTMNEHHHRTRWSFFCLVMSLPVMNKETSCLTHDCDIQTQATQRRRKESTSLFSTNIIQKVHN